MAGVISTATWVDGRFMERNVSIDAILSANAVQDGIKLDIDKPPNVGLLTQTVIQSPISNWILPARLGNADDHDVIFIGDNTVRIKRLIKSGHLSDVGKIAHLGSRIRNARVLGAIKFDPAVPEGTEENDGESSGSHDNDTSKEHDDSSGDGPEEVWRTEQVPETSALGDVDVCMTNMDTAPIDEDFADINMLNPAKREEFRLGPQMVVLVLETGDLIFLFAPDLGPGALIRPFLSRHAIAKTLLSENPGAHLTGDPSSRYLALACSENTISVYALHSSDALRAQYVSGQSFSCVKEERFLQVKGVILKIEFLFPSFKDPDHIILLVLIVRKGKTRMHIYEWAAGQPLSAIRQNHMKGHLLDECYRIPLLLIPLTIKSAFLLVCEQSIVVCEGLLEGDPQCRPSNIGFEEPTPLHKGKNAPLWTSWTRPVRTEKYAATHDDIYIAREDGLVKFLESNLDEFLSSEMNVDSITCNIGTTFASLDSKFPGTDGIIGDILVIGGDSCPGGLYWVQAREPARLLTPFQNWTPMNDFVTIPENQTGPVPGQQPTSLKATDEILWNPERIFGCTGRGTYGTVSEIRHGIEAEIWMELDGLETVTNGAWVLPREPATCSHEEGLLPASSLFLLTNNNESLLLTLQGIGSGITGAAEVNSTWLDLSSRTLDAAFDVGFIIQITERYIRMSDKSPMSNASDHSTTDVYSEAFSSNQIVVAASIHQNKFILVAFQTENGNFHMDTFNVELVKSTARGSSSSNESPLVKIGSSCFLDFYPTFLSFVNLGEQRQYAVTGHEAREARSNSRGSPEDIKPDNDISTLCLYQIHGTLGIVQEDRTKILLSETCGMANGPVDSCVSILALSYSHTEEGLDKNAAGLLLAGHRNGLLFMVYYTISSEGDFRQGVSTSRRLGVIDVMICRDPTNPAVALIACGSDLYRIVYTGVSSSFPQVVKILLKSSGTSIYRQPSVDFICQFNGGILVISRGQLLGIEINNEATEISNNTELPGSASRMFYSPTMESLVVATSVDGRPTIVILDRCTGIRQVISLKHLQSSRRTGRILSLAQWWLQPSKDQALKEELIVAGTSSGTMFILRQDRSDFQDTAPKSQVANFHTYIEQRFSDPIYAFLQGGPHEDIVFCCVGNTLHAMQINIDDRSVASLAEYQLPSHAVSMTWEGQFLNVLTAKDSIITLLYKRTKSFQLHFVDEVTRAGLDHMTFVLDDNSAPGKRFTLLLVSDKDCSVVGLHYQGRATNGHVFPREYTTLFDAEMLSCITKFRLTSVRPKWDTSYKECPLSGVILWGKPWEDLLGISINGSVQKFTLLGETLWKLLSVLQQFARQVPKLGPAATQEGADLLRVNCEDAREKHIDGDLLSGWLMFRNLQAFLNSTTSTPQGTATVDDFMNAVAIHWPESDLGSTNEERIRTSTEMVYHLLEQLLQPII